MLKWRPVVDYVLTMRVQVERDRALAAVEISPERDRVDYRVQLHNRCTHIQLRHQFDSSNLNAR